MLLAALLLAFVIIAGPTLVLGRTLFNAFIDYVYYLPDRNWSSAVPPNADIQTTPIIVGMMRTHTMNSRTVRP